MDRVYPNNFKNVLDELEPLPPTWSRYDAHESYLNKTEDVYHLNFQQDEDYVDFEENEETESDDKSKVSMTPKKRKFDDDSADDTPEGHVQPV